MAASSSAAEGAAAISKSRASDQADDPFSVPTARTDQA
jgi:hypothetical protein